MKEMDDLIEVKVIGVNVLEYDDLCKFRDKLKKDNPGAIILSDTFRRNRRSDMLDGRGWYTFFHVYHKKGGSRQ